MMRVCLLRDIMHLSQKKNELAGVCDATRDVQIDMLLTFNQRQHFEFIKTQKIILLRRNRSDRFCFHFLKPN